MKRMALLLLFLFGFLTVSCSIQNTSLPTSPTLYLPSPVPEVNASPSIEPLPSVSPLPVATASPNHIATRMVQVQSTLAYEQTDVFETSAAYGLTESAGLNQTSTAILHEILVTVTPRTFQSLRSPDGQWLARVRPI